MTSQKACKEADAHARPAQHAVAMPSASELVLDQAHKSKQCPPPARIEDETVDAKQVDGCRPPFPFAGILASLLGSVFFSCSLLCIKLMPAHENHPSDPSDHTSGLADKTRALFFRGLFICSFCGATMLVQRTSFLIRRQELLINSLRCLFAFVGVYGAYLALNYISMGDSTALVFSSPVWTSLLSRLILKEPLDWCVLALLPPSLLGIVLIAHPALLVPIEHLGGDLERQPELAPLEEPPLSHPLDRWNATAGSQLTLVPLNGDLDAATMASEHYDLEHRWPGIVIALGTSLMVSLVYICLKFRTSTAIQTTTFWLGVTTVLGTLLVQLLLLAVGAASPQWLPGGQTEWLLLAANGLCSWLGQALLQWALMYENASVLAVVRTLDVAMTFTLSALFLEEQILWTSVLGATIIGLVVVSIVLNNWIKLRRSRSRSSSSLVK